MKHIFITATTLLLTLFTVSAYSNNTDGIIIEDKEPYPLYQHSQLIEQGTSSAIILKNKRQNTYSTVVDLLKKTGISYQVISQDISQATSKAPSIIQTDWISWHFDADSKKTLSSQNNRFFTLNTRDKYKFRLSIKDIQQHPAITLDKVDREQQVDITPDTGMVWLKWKQEEPDAEAVNAFMHRLQTEYEIHALESKYSLANKPLAISANAANEAAANEATANEVATNKTVDIAPVGIVPVFSSQLSIDMNIDQAWALVIKQLSIKSVPLASVHNDQHMLNSKWFYAKFDSKTNQLNITSKEDQRHQFQLIVVPGSTRQTSSIFVYHTAFQQNSSQSQWSDKETRQEIAGAFLKTLDLKQ